jgi:hypothetical protein
LANLGASEEKLQTGSGSNTGCVPMGKRKNFGKISLAVTPKVFT